MKKIVLSIIEVVLAIVAVIMFLSADMVSATISDEQGSVYPFEVGGEYIFDPVNLAILELPSVVASMARDEGAVAPLDVIGTIIVISLIITASVSLMRCLVPIFKELNKVVGNVIMVIFPIITILISVSFMIVGSNLELGYMKGMWKSTEYNLRCKPDFPFYLYITVLVFVVICNALSHSKTIRDSEEKTMMTANKKVIASAENLKQYKELLDSGAITTEEYEEMKKQILNLK